MSDNQKVHRDRQLLTAAQEKGTLATFASFFRLSGPGWLQGAITLGGGSLASALYLGAVAGTQMMWLMLVAIVVGVIMLSAISYVTLSTGRRPYEAINEYVNPVLGVGWITATILANLIWIMPQFSLCFDAIEKNLGGDSIGNDLTTKIVVSALLFAAALGVILVSFGRGWISRIFDVILKLLVAGIICCFVAAVIYLFRSDMVSWSEILRGFIPDLRNWNQPATAISELINQVPAEDLEEWKELIVKQQRRVMISTTGTAVGINMTFLLPYSMLARGWDRPFRGLARFDLWTGLAIPFLLVTSCIVIAAAAGFHAKADEAFLGNDRQAISESSAFDNARSAIKGRIVGRDEAATKRLDEIAQQAKSEDWTDKQIKAAEEPVLLDYFVTMSAPERQLALTLAKPSTARFAESLRPVLKDKAELVFGLGVFAMGFTTIIILMLINGFAVAEIFGRFDNVPLRIVGSTLAGLAGIAWIWVWSGDYEWTKNSRTWLMIMASTFGAVLLPIAYIAFLALMNNRKLLGDDKPTGVRMGIWNLLMVISVIAALVQSSVAIIATMDKPVTGNFVIGGVVVFALLALVGFSARGRSADREERAD